MDIEKDGVINHGYWLVAFVDLLGQQEAFLKTDYIPEAEDAAKRDAFLAEVRASVGVVRTMRRMLDNFQNARAKAAVDNSSPLNALPPAGMTRARTMLERQVRDHRWSDGVMLSCPLMPHEGHVVPILGVYDVLCTCASLMLIQLAMGHPIRGGIDVGTGMDVDDELFGASLVKAYRLESKHACHPRLVVGQDLVAYLKTSTNAPGQELEREFERRIATNLLALIMKDEDGQWILDYAGTKAREFMIGDMDTSELPVFANARVCTSEPRGISKAGAGRPEAVRTLLEGRSLS